MRKYIVFDIDGTLSDTDKRRLVFLRTEPKNWDAFHFGSINDPIRKEVYKIYEQLCEKLDYRCVVLTARPERYRNITLEWLKKYNIKFDYLLMRPENDFRKDGLVKYDEIKKLEELYGNVPSLVIDDSECVISMLEENNYIYIDAKELN